jgi:hypothetical protein
MLTNPSNTGSTLIPCLRYRDAARAICRDLEGHAWSIGTYDPWKQ